MLTCPRLQAEDLGPRAGVRLDACALIRSAITPAVVRKGNASRQRRLLLLRHRTPKDSWWLILVVINVSRCYENSNKRSVNFSLGAGHVLLSNGEADITRGVYYNILIALQHTHSLNQVRMRAQPSSPKMLPTALDIVLRALSRRPMNVYSSARATVRHLDKVLTGALTLAKTIEKDAPISVLLFEFSGEICWSAPLSCHSRWICMDRSRPLLYQLLIEVSQVFFSPFKIMKN